MEDERTQHEGLWERIFSRENLFKALARVESNKGAPGVDGMTTEELADHLREHWAGIRARLDGGVYQPSPVKRTMIPKPGGGERQLGIPMLLSYCTSCNRCLRLAWVRNVTQACNRCL
jgi:RNA-directed DNA polymerase